MMTSENEKTPFGEDSAKENKSADASTGASDDTDSDADEESSEARLEAPEAELEAEVADLKDKLLRALAETENVRRRAQRDQEDANKYAIMSFAREIIEVRDNLRRALDAVDDELRQNNEAIANLLEGIEMTDRMLLATFERFEIKSIDALHQKFDHNFHEALFEVEDASVPSGTVVQEVQAGYKIHDRLLRPSKVGVSKGGAKAEAGSASEEPADDAPGEQSVKKSAQAYEQLDPDSGAKIDKEL